ncbi:DUF2332 domain-containing protein [Nocardia nepalensis]|uniref:DUF2332 domain-containing protein n=1 Tax=Nocardia nepalensis TaxID=3375448 RepID=UPI003B6800DB
MDTAQRYRLFAETEARGNSPRYEQWCLGIAETPELLALIEQLPEPKRQPNLVLGATRYVGVPDSEFPEFERWLIAHWDTVREVASARNTQTNEAGRTAVLLPVLAQLPGPLSLIEVGASAGLCLYPDRYSYHYDDRPALDPQDGPSPVALTCTTSGNPLVPEQLPSVLHRAGVDLNPLDVTDSEAMHWLECLVWPGRPERLDRLRAAIDIAQQDPPRLVAGDINAEITDLVQAAPRDTTVVVFGSAVLAYLDAEARAAFEETVRGLPCHWISNEGAHVIRTVADQLPEPLTDRRGQFVVALDGRPLAYAGPHGQTLDWFAADIPA